MPLELIVTVGINNGPGNVYVLEDEDGTRKLEFVVVVEVGLVPPDYR